MNNEHIIALLEEKPLAALDAAEIATLRAHTQDCAECRREWTAARVAANLLKERAAQTFEPSPFFQTRVLAAWRERQAQEEPAWQRLWRSAWALVSAMAAAVVLLLALTVLTPVTPPTPGGATSELAQTDSADSDDDVMLDQGEPTDEQLSYDQVMTVLDNGDDDGR